MLLIVKNTMKTIVLSFALICAVCIFAFYQESGELMAIGCACLYVWIMYLTVKKEDVKEKGSN